VGEVEFFQVGEGGESGDVGEAVGLDGDYAEVGESVQVLDVLVHLHGIWQRVVFESVESTHLHLCDLVLSEPKLLERGKRVEILDFLSTQVNFEAQGFLPLHHLLISSHTLIRFAPSSRFRNLSSPSSPSIREILFWTK
jgi:hypothetical protein